MQILPVQIEDAAAIRTLMAQVIATSLAGDDTLKQDMVANTYKNLDFWLAQPEHCLHLKASLNDEIVGVILVKNFWNLCSLFVAQAQQGSGIGRALLHAAQARCSGKSEKGAILLNAAPNAIAFYQRCGAQLRTATTLLPSGFAAMEFPLQV